jgi:hypothetical protein
VTDAVQLAQMNSQLQSLIGGGFISPLTLAIVLNCQTAQIDKLLRSEAVDDELAPRVEELVEQYRMAIRRVNAETLRESIDR